MNLHKNIQLWFVTTFFSYAAFTLPIWVIFNTDVLGLSNTQAFLLGVMPFGLGAFFEIPTGAWADKYGRVKTFQIGMVLFILSVASYIFFTNFYVLLAFQVIGGFGYAMKSGGLEALVYESLDTKDRGHTYTHIHGKKMAVSFASRVITVLAGSALYVIDPKLPFILTVAMLGFGIFCSFAFTDTQSEKPTAGTHFEHIKETTGLLFQNTTVAIFLVFMGLYIFASEAMFAMYQPYFQSLNIEIGEFGIFYATISALSALGALMVTRVVKKYDSFVVLLALLASVITTLSIMLVRDPLVAYAAIIPSSLAFGFVRTIKNTTLQKLVGSKHQATAVSIGSFLYTMSLLVSVMFVGVMLDHTSVLGLNWALTAIASASLLAGAAVLILRRQRLATS